MCEHTFRNEQFCVMSQSGSLEKSFHLCSFICLSSVNTVVSEVPKIEQYAVRNISRARALEICLHQQHGVGSGGMTAYCTECCVQVMHSL